MRGSAFLARRLNARPFQMIGDEALDFRAPKLGVLEVIEDQGFKLEKQCLGGAPFAYPIGWELWIWLCKHST